MDYDIIKSRHSVRTYTLQPLSADEVVMLDSQIRRYNAEGSLNMQLVVNEPNAFGRSLMAHYGKFRNVTNYIALTGPKSNDTEAKLGYYGEKIVLEAQKAGLNTCWVGLSFSKKNTSIDIPDGNKLYALIAIGHGAESGATHRINATTDKRRLRHSPRLVQTRSRLRITCSNGIEPTEVPFPMAWRQPRQGIARHRIFHQNGPRHRLLSL